MYKQLLAQGKADLLTQIMNGETTLEAEGLVEAPVTTAKVVSDKEFRETVKSVPREKPKKKDLGSYKKSRVSVRRR